MHILIRSQSLSLTEPGQLADSRIQYSYVRHLRGYQRVLLKVGTDEGPIVLAKSYSIVLEADQDHLHT